jgi:hypothetical protein
MKRILLLSLLSFQAQAIQIAFLSRTHMDGNIESLEPNGRYVHVAALYKNKWLQAHPYYGVILSDNLEGLGKIEEIFEIYPHLEISEKFLSEVLEKPYNFISPWDDPLTYNCSKLIAKLLDIKPKPMTFEESIWGDRFAQFRGQLGLSPDELFHEIQSLPNVKRLLNLNCADILKK